MFTILIADDEKLIRAGIHKILCESINIPLTIFEAKNGEEALSLCASEKPDLLITDIRMPRLDGVSLMRKVSEFDEKPAVIVLSGYDDFSYAKEAIRSGAVSYILKPVDKNELVQAVDSVVANVKSTRKKKSEQIIRMIAEEGIFKSPNGRGNAIHFENGFCAMSISGEKCSETFEKITKPISSAYASCYLIEKKKNFISAVISRETAISVEREVSKTPLSVGISTFSDNLSSIRLLRLQSFSAMLCMFFATGTANANINDNDFNYARTSGVWHYSDESSISDFSEIDAVYEKVIGRLCLASSSEKFKSDEIKSGIDLIFSTCALPTRFQPDDTGATQKNAASFYYLYNKIVTNLFHRFPLYTERDMYLSSKSIMIENIHLFSSLLEWKSCVADYTIYLSFLLRHHDAEYPFVTEAIEYVSKHFAGNINMATTANYVSTNYSWFSEKFKEQTGISFNDYLKRLRLDEAKRLLSKGCYKVYEVASRSGFNDVKYFMKTFREATGMSPGEYREQNSQKLL